MSKLPYNLALNMGNAVLGTEPTVTANEHIVETLSTKEVSEEINHLNPLIPAKVAQQVLDSWIDAILPLMARGKAIQFNNQRGEVMLRLHPDLHLTNPEGKAWTLAQINKHLLPKDTAPLTTLTSDSISGLNFASLLSLSVAVEPGIVLSRSLQRLNEGYDRQSVEVIKKVEKKDSSTTPTTPTNPSTPGKDLEE